MGPGLFGKLPARGDFVTRGIPSAVLAPWESWLNDVTQGSREALGADWERAWDSAPVWRFWIGAWVPGGPAAGALRPSRDSVGRRYPLMILWSGGIDEAPPPPVQPDPDTAAWYDAVAACLWRLTDRDAGEEPASAMTGLTIPPLVAVPADPRGAFFAEAEAGLSTLIADVAPHDHSIAALRRTYWWSGTTAEAAMLGQEGMPDVGGFVALLSALASNPPTASKPSENVVDADREDSPPKDPSAAWRRPGAPSDEDPSAAWHVGPGRPKGGAGLSGAAVADGLPTTPPVGADAAERSIALAPASYRDAAMPPDAGPDAGPDTGPADDHSPFGSADESPFAAGQEGRERSPRPSLSSVFRRRH